MCKLKYRYNFFDVTWFITGLFLLGLSGYSMSFELFMASLPMLVLSFKLIVQGMYVDDLLEEISEIEEEYFDKEYYAQPYVVADSADDKWCSKRSK